MADSVERKLFMPTNAVEAYPLLAPLFDNSKCENIILHKEDCQNEKCLQEDDCRLDRGSPFCYSASKEAYALLDPYWIDGPAKHIKRAPLRWVFILRSDNVSPPIVEMAPEDALRILESGESLGAARSLTASKREPFFNPHLLVTDGPRLDLQKNFYRRLLDSTTCYLFNSGVATGEDLKKTLTGETESQETS